ncbi:TetR/AcrR family transcriptional regulator [Phycicoccus sp. CMS6Z-2]|nr:TetR/AcrR family transcriptional regulator [Phycicoccus flavus]
MAKAQGRPRDASRDVVIFDAVLEMLLEVGYDRLSIGGVAERAGVGKATVYRRYPDKASLVTAAVDRRARPDSRRLATPPADMREMLLETVRRLGSEISTQGAGLLYAMFAGMRSDPQLAANMQQVLRRDTDALVSVLRHDTLDGVAPLSPAAASLVGEVAPALILHRLTVEGQPCDELFVQHVVDDILLPLVRSS